VEKTSRPTLLIYSALNIAGALVLILVAIENWAWPRPAFADYGAPLGLIILFPLIPMGLIASRRFAPIAVAPSQSVRRYLRLSQVFLAGMWLLSCVPIALLVMLLEPWPLSLRQGPDTATAKAGFAGVFGDDAGGVARIYYRKESGWGDATIYLRFDVDDRVRLAALANNAGLVVYASGAPRPSPPQGPSWWDSHSIDAADSLFIDVSPGRTVRALWLSAGSTTAYYYEFRP
jgi:hypothetical protein